MKVARENSTEVNQYLTSLLARLKGDFTSKRKDLEQFSSKEKNLTDAVKSYLDTVEKYINEAAEFSIQNESHYLQTYTCDKLDKICQMTDSFLKTELSKIEVDDESKRKIIEQVLDSILDDINDIKTRITPPKKMPTTPKYAQDRKIRNFQLRIKGENNTSTLKKDFTDVLSKIKQLSRSKQWGVPKVFISYAWPTDYNTHEDWIQPFLVDFCEHLELTGIITYLDINDSRRGYNTNSHMLRMNECDYIILIGTESLYLKDSHGCSMVCTELNLARSIVNGKSGKVIPILLSGDFNDAFPPGFTRYTAIESFKIGYLTQLKQLIKHLFLNNNSSSAYNDIWSHFETLHQEEFNNVASFDSPTGKTSSEDDTSSPHSASPSKNNGPSRKLSGSLVRFGTPMLSSNKEKSSISLSWNMPEEVSYHVSTQEDNLIREYIEKLSDKDNAILLLKGRRGSGKTHAATRIIFSTDSRFSIRVFFDAQSKMSLLDQCRKLIISKKLPDFRVKVDQDTSDSIVLASFKDYFCRRSDWMIVYENAESYAFLREFLPDDIPGLVVATSSNENQLSWDGTAAELHKIEIQPLSPQAGTQLFLHSMGINENQSDNYLPGTRIEAFLDGKKSPYIIKRAGTYVLWIEAEGRAVTGKKIKIFVDKYTQLAVGLSELDLCGWFLTKFYSELENANNKNLHKTCMSIMDFFALFSRDNLHEEILNHFISNFVESKQIVNKAIEWLIRYKIIAKKTINGSIYYSIDGLTQNSVRLQKKAGSLNKLIVRVACLFTLYLDKDKYEIHSNQRESLPHFFEFLAYLEELKYIDPSTEMPNVDSIFIKVFSRAQAISGQWGGADMTLKGIQYAEKVLKLTKHYYGCKNIKYVKALISMAAAYSERQGIENLKTARKYYLDGCSILDTIIATEGIKRHYKSNLYKSECKRGVGQCYFNLSLHENDEEEMRKLLNKSVEYYSEADECYKLCSDAPTMIRENMFFRIYNCIALAYWKLKNHKAAVEKFEELLESRIAYREKRSNSPTRYSGKIEEAMARVNLGMCQYDLGNYAKGIESLEGIKMLEDAIANHPGLGLAYYYHGLCLLKENSKIKEAISLIENGIVLVRENVFSPQHAFVNFLKGTFTDISDLIESEDITATYGAEATALSSQMISFVSWCENETESALKLSQ